MKSLNRNYRTPVISNDVVAIFAWANLCVLNKGVLYVGGEEDECCGGTCGGNC